MKTFTVPVSAKETSNFCAFAKKPVTLATAEFRLRLQIGYIVQNIVNVRRTDC